MRRWLLLGIGALLAMPAAVFAQATAGQPAASPAPGMALYYFGLLNRGPAWTPEKTEATERIQAGHMANINRMAAAGALAAAGKLAAVGPVTDGGPIAGIVVFNTDAAEAVRLASEDPLVKAGRLKIELFTWWCAERVMPDKLPPVPVLK